MGPSTLLLGSAWCLARPSTAWRWVRWIGQQADASPSVGVSWAKTFAPLKAAFGQRGSQALAGERAFAVSLTPVAIRRIQILRSDFDIRGNEAALFEKLADQVHVLAIIRGRRLDRLR